MLSGDVQTGGVAVGTLTSRLCVVQSPKPVLMFPIRAVHQIDDRSNGVQVLMAPLHPWQAELALPYLFPERVRARIVEKLCRLLCGEESGSSNGDKVGCGERRWHKRC